MDHVASIASARDVMRWCSHEFTTQCTAAPRARVARKRQTVGDAVHRAKLALVHEPGEARSDAEACGLVANRSFEGPGADDDRSRTLHFRDGTDDVEGPFFLFELSNEQHDECV